MTVLHFKAEAPGEYRANFRDVVGVFPPKVNHVLSNLSQFPNLRTLIVDFDFHIHNGPDGMDYHWDFLLYASSGVNDETVEEVEEAERQEGWRALVKKTLLAVSSQGTDSVQAFVFKIYPINTNSVFGSAVLNKVCPPYIPFQNKLSYPLDAWKSSDTYAWLIRRRFIPQLTLPVA